MALPHEQKPRKARKGWKITAGILLVLIAAVIGIGIWQRNNIEAVVQYTKYTQEELETQLQDNDAAIEDALQAALDAAKQVDAEAKGEAPDVSDTVVTPEVPSESKEEPQGENAAEAPETPAEKPADKPQNGIPQAQKPVEDKVTTPVVTPAPSKPEVQKPTESKPAQPTGDYERQLKVIVDQAYALRSEYVQALEDLQAEAVSAYKAIPAEQRNTKNITSFVNKYINKANALEKACDGKMDALVKDLTALQKKYGQSMELVDTMKYTYANEKSLKKAWYMAELEQRGLI